MSRCIVCNAKVRHGATCDTVCTKARKNGVSREAQFVLDMDTEWSWREAHVRLRGRWSSLEYHGAAVTAARA